MTNLFDSLNQLKDHRREEGKRYSFASMIEMILLAGISGRFGINSISRFISNNSEFFINRYGYNSSKVPSKTALYNFLRDLDFNQMNKVLIQWMKQFIDQEQNIWVSIDGKVMCSTVEDTFSNNQNFKVIVSAFCNDLGIVIDSEKFENKENSEGTIARKIIERLKLKGVILTLDAHHCQKKQSPQPWWMEMTV